MTETIYISLKDLSRERGVTVDQLKYWSKLLNIRTVTRSRTAHIKIGDADKLKEVAAMVAAGMSPSEACRNVSPETSQAQIGRASPPSPLDGNRLDGIEKSLLLLVDEIKFLRQENQTARLENRMLKGEISTLRNMFLEQKEEQKRITQEKEKPLPVEVPEPPAPIRAEVPRQVVKEPVQRQLSFLESVSVTFDNFLGFVWGD